MLLRRISFVLSGLVRALRRKGDVQVETLIFPDEKHGLSLFSSQLKAATATVAFLAKHLNLTMAPSIGEKVPRQNVDSPEVMMW